MITNRIFLSAALPLAVFAFLFPLTPETERDDEIREIARLLDAGEVVENWDLVARLESMGEDAAPLLEKALPGAGEKARLGLAKALISLDRKESGIEVIKNLTFEAKDVEVRRSAARILESRADRPDLRALGKRLSRISDPIVKITVAKALARDFYDRSAFGVLKEFLASERLTERAEAAIALAEIGDFESGRSVLEDIQFEPTPRGRIARRLIEDEFLLDAEERVAGLEKDELVEKQRLRIYELETKLEKLQESGPGDPLLEELITRILANHVDGEVTREQLLEAAAKGMVTGPGSILHGPLDKFSAYMNVKETEKFHESIKGVYAGIGAVVAVDKETKFLTIVRPILPGPAHSAGIRSNDVVLEVNGRSTWGEVVGTMVDIIRGKPGTKVSLKISRRGWREPRIIDVVREDVKLPIAHGNILPGKVGYLNLLHFGEQAEVKMGEILDDLEDQGMEALILDLRGNPGGLLEQARRVAGMFLNERKLVVRSKGRNPHIVPERNYRAGGSSARPDYPVVILVNGKSASASEIVAGALQDYERARLIGETTFGKGSVQRPFTLDATGGKAILKLTVAQYFLPLGRNIHEEGVVPDIQLKGDASRDIDYKAWVKLTEEKAFEKYVGEKYEANKELLDKLAEFDGKDPSGYPDFDLWYDSLATKLSREEVRYILRIRVRDRVEEERGRVFPLDLQEDLQLQRAVVEALSQLGRSHREIAQYEFFPEEFPETVSKAEVR